MMSVAHKSSRYEPDRVRDRAAFRWVRQARACVLLVFLSGAAFCSGQAPFIEAAVEAGGHTGNVRDLCYSADGSVLATAGWDKTVRIWDTATGRIANVLRGPIGVDGSGEQFAVCFLGGKQRRIVAAGGIDVDPRMRQVYDVTMDPDLVQRIRLFDIDSGKIVRTLGGRRNGKVEGHKGYIVSLTAHPSLPLLVSSDFGSDKSKVLLWNSETGELIRELAAGNAVTAMRFSPSGRLLLTGDIAGSLRVYDTSSWESRNVGSPLPGGVLRVAWSADGTFWATSGPQGDVQVREGERQAGNPVSNPLHVGMDTPKAAAKMEAPAIGLAFDSKGRLLIVPAESSFFRQTRVSVRSGPSWSESGSFSLPDGGLIALASHRGNLAVSGANGAVFQGDDFGVRRWRVSSGSGMISGIAWNQEEQSLQWRIAGRAGPLTFLLREAQIVEGTPLSESSYGPQTAGGKTTLSVAEGGRTLEVRTGGGSPNRVPADGQIRSYALIGEDRFALGTEFSLNVFDLKGRKLFQCVGHHGAVESLRVAGNWLFSGGLDQTLRAWNLDTKPKRVGIVRSAIEPEFSIFARDHEQWVAWTQRGFFAASPGGAALLGWNVSRGPDQASEFSRAGQFRKRFYRPDILCRIFETGSADAAKRAADEAAKIPDSRREETSVPDLAAAGFGEVIGVSMSPSGSEGALPRMAFGDPGAQGVEFLAAGDLARGFLSDREGVDIRVRFSSSDRIDEIRVNVGRVPYRVPVSQATKKGDDLEVVIPAKLAEGGSEVTAFVRTKNGDGSPSRIKVSYNPPGGFKPGRLAIVAIGIGDYQNLQTLHYADDDAKEFMQFYRDKAFPDLPLGPTLLITDPNGSREQIEAALATLEGKLEPNDRLLVLISGHGSSYRVEGEALPRTVFCPTDFDPAKPQEKGIGWSVLLARLASLKAHDIVLLCDACRSGGLAKELVRGTSDAMEIARQATDGDHNIRVVMSCESGSSFEYGIVKYKEDNVEKSQIVNHGVFSFVLLQALTSLRPSDSTQTITLDAVFRRLKAQVGNLVYLFSNEREEQTPTFFPKNEGQADDGDQLLWLRGVQMTGRVGR